MSFVRDFIACSDISLIQPDQQVVHVFHRYMIVNVVTVWLCPCCCCWCSSSVMTAFRPRPLCFVKIYGSGYVVECCRTLFIVEAIQAHRGWPSRRRWAAAAVDTEPLFWPSAEINRLLTVRYVTYSEIKAIGDRPLRNWYFPQHHFSWKFEENLCNYRNHSLLVLFSILCKLGTFTSCSCLQWKFPPIRWILTFYENCHWWDDSSYFSWKFPPIGW